MQPVSDEKFAAAAEKLPSTPEIFGRVSAALRNPDVDLDDIACILKLDAALSARLLRLGNSAAAAAPATDLAEAIQRIGFREVYRVIGVAMAGRLYVSGLPIYGLGGTELWENSVATAIALEKLAVHGGGDGRGAYTLGLLRSVGRLLMQRLAAGHICAPLAGRKETGALVLAWERENLGLTSTEAAVRLFQLWKLSPELAAPLSHHFSPLADPERGALPALLHLACGVAEKLEFPLAIEADVWSDAPEILAQAGVTREVLEQVTAETGAEVGALRRAATFQA